MARPIDGNSYVGGEDNYSDGEDVQVHEGVRQVAENQDTQLSSAGFRRGLDDVDPEYFEQQIEFSWAASGHSTRQHSDRCPFCQREYDREEDFSNVGRITTPF